MLRELGVVSKFVEFYGEGAANLSLADRCPVANMGPEYGATMGFFAIDEKTIEYLKETGRTDEQCELVEAYCKAQGLWGLQMRWTIVPRLSSTSTPLKRSWRGLKPIVPLSGVKQEFQEDFSPSGKHAEAVGVGSLPEGAVVIASITSCTNTSNPSLVMGAGIVAKKAVEKVDGSDYVDVTRTWFSVATEYLKESGLLNSLETLGFNVAAYGCATCIGNSGPLDEPIDAAIRETDLTVAAVLGNRNFEGRVHPLTDKLFSLTAS